MRKEQRLLALGCGECSPPGWLAVDAAPGPGVWRYDLRLGIPFADGSADAVYHAHVHAPFSDEEWTFFLRDCYRVLKSGGLLCLALPNWAQRPGQPEREGAAHVPGRLLEELGFTDVTRSPHGVSLLPEVTVCGLDADASGKPCHPGFVYLEARKPEAGQAAKPRVALFSTSETGGAGIAALRVHNSLRSAGLHSSMYVVRQMQQADGLHIVPLKRQYPLPVASGRGMGLSYIRDSRRADPLAAYPNRPPGQELFSVPGGCAGLDAMLFPEDFDVFNLHWVTEAVDMETSLQTLSTRPVIWTLHDMRPFTGGCHYAGECRRFTDSCGACPQLGSTDPHDISFLALRTAAKLYRHLDLHIVAPSAWMVRQAQASTLFRQRPAHVIRHAVPLDVYRPLQRDVIRQGLGIAPDERVLLFSAQNIFIRRKGMDYLREALARAVQEPFGKRLRILLLGHADSAVAGFYGLRVETPGHVDDPGALARLYNAADAVVTPSLEDNAPNVIAEAAACGTPVVAFAAGGVPEMIRHQETGWLAPLQDVAGLLAGIRWACEAGGDPGLRLRCRALALELWNPSDRAQEYRRLFAEARDAFPSEGQMPLRNRR